MTMTMTMTMTKTKQISWAGQAPYGKNAIK